MLFDTDVLIWVLRGSRQAAAAIDAAPARFVSIVNYMELIQGARDRKELAAIKKFLSGYFDTLPLTENTGHRAAIYIEEYGISSGMRLADALIAATAVEHCIPVCTGNVKHYKIVKELEIVQFKKTGKG
jgi:predicted nucleic acid-binding protein